MSSEEGHYEDAEAKAREGLEFEIMLMHILQAVFAHAFCLASNIHDAFSGALVVCACHRSSSNHTSNDGLNAYPAATTQATLGSDCLLYTSPSPRDRG
eukprot:3266802-Amphidinium_carterae.1